MSKLVRLVLKGKKNSSITFTSLSSDHNSLIELCSFPPITYTLFDIGVLIILKSSFSSANSYWNSLRLSTCSWVRSIKPSYFVFILNGSVGVYFIFSSNSHLIKEKYFISYVDPSLLLISSSFLAIENQFPELFNIDLSIVISSYFIFWRIKWFVGEIW